MTRSVRSYAIPMVGSSPREPPGDADRRPVPCAGRSGSISGQGRAPADASRVAGSTGCLSRAQIARCSNLQWLARPGMAKGAPSLLFAPAARLATSDDQASPSLPSWHSRQDVRKPVRRVLTYNLRQVVVLAQRIDRQQPQPAHPALFAARWRRDDVRDVAPQASSHSIGAEGRLSASDIAGPQAWSEVGVTTNPLNR